MEIQVTTRHGSLSDASREKVVEKVQRLQKFFDRLSSIEVVVDLQDESVPKVDMKVAAEHKHDFMAHHQSETSHSDALWTSLDIVLQKIEQQLRKYKEKVQSRHRNHELRRQEQHVDSDAGSDQ